jgi:eukaryotic-like serine/threonine-protein kinase
MLRSAEGTCVVDGRYRLAEKLGVGGSATVYRAEDLGLQREIAIKVLHPRLAGDDELVERFRREAASAARLSHPHVVTIYDRGEFEGTHYIAMEYVAGRSLKSIIRDEAPLGLARAIDLIVQMLRAAGEIHGRGIVHRDLKPHNAIVDPADRLKVTDFGVARTRGSDLTEHGSIFGSAHYLSPEQAEGGTVSAASDLYSVGVTLYELLAGRLPFRGDTALSVAMKHVNERPVPPTYFNAAVTPELESAVMRALEKDPARRFTDADAFINVLQSRTETTHEHHLGSRDHQARNDRPRGFPHSLRHVAAGRRMGRL